MSPNQRTRQRSCISAAGWQPVGDLGNIAGNQGYLDFKLKDSAAIIERTGLKAQVVKNQKPITLAMRSDNKVRVKFFAVLDGEQKPRDFGSIEAVASEDQRKWLLDLVEFLELSFIASSRVAQFGSESGRG